MADSDPVNFTMGAARQVRESVRVTQRIAHNERGRERKWPIPEDGLSSGFGVIDFEITDIIRGRGLLCNAVEAIVLNVACGVTGVAVNDVITVWDDRLCRFQLPMNLLIGVQGTAIRMNTVTTFYDGGAEQETPCHWAVLTLCCVEEAL